MNRQSAIVILMFLPFLTLQGTLSAAGVVPLYPKLPPFQESLAYHQFKTRPLTESSKLLYLIDRFADTEIEISYDGHYYNAKFAGQVARWFLARRYQHEPAQQFILKWCNASIPGGNLIWVKFPKGRFRLAREILLEELKMLNAFLEGQKDAKLAESITGVRGVTSSGTPVQTDHASNKALAAESSPPSHLPS